MKILPLDLQQYPLRALALCATFLLGTSACSEAIDSEPVGSPEATEAVTQATEHEDDLQVLQPFLNRCMQIDRINPASPTNPGDANLVYDGPPDGITQPIGCSTRHEDYTDWHELEFNELDITQFQIKDYISGGGFKDPTAFPFGDNRVGAANVLAKQAIVEVAMAVNTPIVGAVAPTMDNPDGIGESYVSVSLLREGTNGSSSWFGIYTQAPSTIGADQRLTFTMSPGDVLIVGDFDPAKGDIVSVYRTNPALNLAQAVNLSAVEVASPDGITPGGQLIWGKREANGGIVGALNTSPVALETDSNKFFDGRDANGTHISNNRLTSNGELEPGAFFEASLPLSLFLDEDCGNIFHGHIITRPSRSRTSTLKDLVGPFILNLGELDPEITLTPTCDGELAFSAAPASLNGENEANGGYPAGTLCTWVITCNGTTLVGPTQGMNGELVPYTNDCSRHVVDVDTTGGPVNCSATVTVGGGATLECAGTANETETVYAPLKAAAVLTPYCIDPGVEGFVSSFGFAGSAKGGTANYEYSWMFESADANGNPTVKDSNPASNESSDQTGDVLVAVGNVIYKSTLVVTDPDFDKVTGVACDDKTTDQTIPLAPLDVKLSVTVGADICPANFGTDSDFQKATFDVTVKSGGSGLYTYKWTKMPDLGFCTDKEDTNDLSASCTVLPDDNQFCGDVSLKARVYSLDPDPDSEINRASCDPADTEVGTSKKVTKVTTSIGNDNGNGGNDTE